jgi:hypothetical protein
MLVLPLTVGALRSGAQWVHLWLLTAWLIGYLAFFATGLWLRSARKARFRPPVVAHGAATAVVGGALLLAEPDLLRWGVVYAPLLVTSLWYSARRAERALLNDVLTVGAASLMAVVAFGLGSPDDGAWLPGAGSAEAGALAAAVFGYLVGTALYVKTMIRERGNASMYRASVIYHAAVAVVFLVWVPVVGAFFAVLAVRAAVVPKRWPRTRPLVIGFGEIAASVLLGVLLLVVPLG